MKRVLVIDPHRSPPDAFSYLLEMLRRLGIPYEWREVRE